jgi:nitroreductase
MTALEAIYQRRAVRDYTGELVDDATLHLLLRAAVHAPTALHLEPWAFAVVQDRELLHRLSERAKIVSRELVRGADVFYDAGTLVVICARPFGQFVSTDCWLAAENFMIAAAAAGLGTCPIGFALAALEQPDLKAALGIPPEVAPVAPIIVGHPRGHTPYVPRHDPEILSWHR